MKKTDKLDDSWDENNLNINLKSKLGRNALIVCTLSIFSLGYYALTNVETVRDANLHYIKSEYRESLSVIDSILANPELSFEFNQALDIKANILLDKKSEYYNKQEGFNTLVNLFSDTSSPEIARRIIILGDDLNKSEQQLFKYIEYLAKEDDVDSIFRISRLYLSSTDNKIKIKAKIYLEKFPETVEKFLGLAELEAINGLNGRTINNIENHLNSAVFQGSGTAMIELAFLQLSKASINKIAATKYRAQFSVYVMKAINMGYRGERLKEAELILKFGREGIQQDLALAKLINQTLAENEHK